MIARAQYKVKNTQISVSLFIVVWFWFFVRSSSFPFEFEFAALSFNQPNKNQYAYYLDGFDPNWHYIGTKRDGRYTNLPGGDYTLFLKAANSS